MTDFNQKKAVGSTSTSYSLYVAGTTYKTNDIVFDEATAGYTPAVGDVLCYNTADTNKHQQYVLADVADLVVMGIVDKVTSDNTTPANTILTVSVDCTVHYSALGTTGLTTAAHKLALINALRAKNIDTDAIM